MASLSIYDISHYLQKTEDGYSDYLISDFLEELKKLPVEKYVNVSDEYLDAVSFEEYGTEELWWVIARYNDIINPMSPGTIVVSLPPLYEINELMLKYRS